jgi:hypothetical protein
VVRKLTLIVIPLLAFGCSAAGQRGFSAGRVGGHLARGLGAQRGGRYWARQALGLGYWDSLFPDDYTEYPRAEPPVVVIQLPEAPAEESEAQFPSPAQPLLIELQGGRYVRVSGEEGYGDSDPGAAMSRLPPGAVETPRASVPPLATILVFRNGSREQITGYTIADGVLYAQANYYTDGSWNKRIALSSLDVAQTVGANRAHGVQFRLPDSANEVIVGP